MKALVLILTALAAAAASAQPATPPPDAGAADPAGWRDPSQLVCRSEPAVGSRLRANRRCATRAQWAEAQRLERQYAEKAQTSRTWCGGVCVRAQNHGR
jgi:hypothetical protein